MTSLCARRSFVGGSARRVSLRTQRVHFNHHPDRAPNFIAAVVAMFEPIRGGTRGGQAEFKWSDVSADKDREVRRNALTK